MVGLGKKSLWSLIIALISACIVLKSIFIGAENRIVNSFAEKVVGLNQEKPFQVTYDKLDISFWNRSMSLKGVLILPDTLVRSNSEIQPHISISMIEAKNFKMIPLLLNKTLDISKIQVDSLEVVIRKPTAQSNIKSKNKPDNNQNALNEIFIKEMEFSHFSMMEISPNKKDTLQSVQGELLTINGIAIAKANETNKPYTLNPKQLSITALNQSINFHKSQTQYFLGQMHLDLPNKKADFVNLKFGEEDSLRVRSNRQYFNKPLVSGRVKNVSLYGIQFDSIWKNKMVLADSVLVEKAELSMLKNNDKPWNKEKTIPLPQQFLRKQKNDFWFDKIRVSGSQLNYFEVDGGEIIEIPINDFNAEIEAVGTAQELYQNHGRKNTEITLDGKIFGNISFSTHLNFHNPMKSNDFSFKGETGSFSFESFNPIMVPTSNIKFESGYVNHIDFSGEGNQNEASGDFVMRFKNLETIVLKRKSSKVNKTFSWLANSAVQKENPKNGKLRFAQMRHQRVPYKGFGNYIFKTIESGLINSVYPLGKRKVVRQE